MFSPIHHTFGPLADKTQCLRALKLLMSGASTKDVEKFRAALEKKFAGYSVHFFASGRKSLLAMLGALKLQKGDEVILQAYTCTVVANAVIAAGATPVYADVDPATLNLTSEAVQKVVTDRTRVVICQHTFGIPAPAEWLKRLCSGRNIFFIEDCAHVLPDVLGPKEIGSEGDAIMLSFGRDKAISGISGGAILVRDQALGAVLKEKEGAAAPLSRGLQRRLLLYPLLYILARPLYGIGIGKAMLLLAKKLGLLIPILTSAEKQGEMEMVLHRIPSACAALAHANFLKLKSLNDHRRMLTSYFLEQAQKRGWHFPEEITERLPLQKFPLFTPRAEEVRLALKKHNIHLDDGWTGCVLCPEDANDEAAGYESGSDPHAEAVSGSILSLPTHPTMTMAQAKELVKRLAAFLPGSDTP